ncbi:YtxH domain-containing protein [Lentibacillus sp. Marseille-P4043]|uniref:YtxH domain-containing protein n=1 Tax=Lentibacillus sp. Marseille-P4043 TaxID=2040293 RepID=UPI000D0BE7A5|nr:YtxH domain-containing protein [Lentibacillus sp. Marseille-P4043]
MGDQQDQSINSKDFMIGTLIGGIVGASVALLYAPKAGKDLRGEINVGASQLRDRASDWKEIAYEKGSMYKNKAVDSASQLTKNVSEKTQGLTKTVQNKLQDKRTKEEEALEAVEEVAEAIEEAADELEKK